MDSSENGARSRLSPAGIIAIVVLLGLLGVAVWYAVHGWRALQGVPMHPLGWVFLGLGIVVTTLVGAGLMALLFYSARHDMDI